jgi:hypothetical protein
MSDTRTDPIALAAGIKRFAPAYVKDLWDDDTARNMAEQLIELEGIGIEISRDTIAHEMWSMGAWLDHPKCHNNPKRGNDADYENGCEACGTYLCAVADSILAAVRWLAPIPAPSTIAVPHTPEEIWAAADVWCDLDFWDKDHLEYTPDGVLHLASNVNITADREHMPVELRPDIGVDY